MDNPAGDPPPGSYCTSVVLIVHHGDDQILALLKFDEGVKMDQFALVAREKF